MEQISHHPPVSYMLVDGPCNSYQWSGYSVFEPSASINSITVKVLGSKRIVFPDGTVITHSPT